ncbi:MAG: DUF2190 family protein [Puniceicoccales bacterium]|jgi:hypothetical protein|nr:DUF2190 family protein [Puniceicoccales bacterium]
MHTTSLYNPAIGTHEDSITKRAKTAIQRNRLVVLDTADPESVSLSNTTSIPFGVSSDEAAAGEILNINFLGCSNTIDIVADGTIAAGKLLIPGQDGKVAAMPGTPGTYTCIGIALATVSDGEVVEVLTSLPYQHTIPSGE